METIPDETEATEEFNDDDLEIEAEVERDQTFINNLDYFIERRDGENPEGSESAMVALIEDSENPTPRGFIAFMRNGEKLFIKKASLVSFLGKEGQRVSSDRLYRYTNARKPVLNDGRVLLGDFVKMKFERAVWVVQVIGFQFANGKKFHGDHYLKETDSTQPVMALCSFFKTRNSILTSASRPQRLINLENLICSVFVRRDMVTGVLTVE